MFLMWLGLELKFQSLESRHLQDGNGFISRSELKHVMMNLGEKMTEEECSSLVEVSGR